MIPSTFHELLVSSSRATSMTATPAMSTSLLEEEEEEQTITSSRSDNVDNKPTPVTPPPLPINATVSIPFPDSDTPPSQCYKYSVGPLAHVKSEGRKSKTRCPCWKLQDFTLTTDSTSTVSCTSSYLGEGKFGTVELYKRSNSNELVAIKTMGKSNSNDRRRLLWKREVEIQTRLSHSNIVQCFGYFQTSTQLHMVLEYVSLGNLAEYANDIRIAVRTKTRLIRHVASALAHLASHCIAHRDVKTENVLVCRGMEGCVTAKLADFGYAIYCNPTAAACWRMTMCGTLACLPPEMIRLDAFGDDDETAASYCYNALLVDSWALGVLAYELVMDSDLFDSTSDRNATKKAICGFEAKRDLLIDDQQTSIFGDFCAKLLEKDPEQRLMPAQALKHEWLTIVTKDTNSKKKRRALKKGQSIRNGTKRRRRQRRQL